MTLSVLTPVRDVGPSFREHVRACVGAVSDLDVELVVLDDRSVDGCCQGLPTSVLIIRTERLESPSRLWRLGTALAGGESHLWLPSLLSQPPDQFRVLVMAALDYLADGRPSEVVPARPRRRFFAAWRGPFLRAPRDRARIGRYARIPVLGGLASLLAESQFRPVIPLSANGTETSLPSGEAVDRANARASDNGSDEPGPKAQATPISRAVRPGAIRLSVIITAYNEGAEVLRTVQSVRDNTQSDHEIIVVDDGSTDGSCLALDGLGARVIRHPERVGVAHARDVGTRAAVGDVFAYLDAHQRVDPGCLDRCAEIAALYGAIVCPPCRPLNRRYAVGYGACFRLCPERGIFSSHLRIDRPSQEITRISGLRSPGYVIPRSAYKRVVWITGLRGWGATDYCLALKAFFADVDILLANVGGTSHLFRKRIPYETTWEGVWRNHALIARVCFDDRTWRRYWLPEVFRGNLTDDAVGELDSPAVLAERDAFLAQKVRPDREFWRGLLRIPEPSVLM